MKTEWPYTFKIAWSALRYPAGSRKKRKRFHEEMAVAMGLPLKKVKQLCHHATTSPCTSAAYTFYALKEKP